MIDRGAVDEREPGFYRSEVELSANYWKALAILVSPSEVTAAVVDHTGLIDTRITKKTGNRNRPESYRSLLHELLSEVLDSVPDVVVSVS
ncbi:MAG: hypothetical protein P1V20_32585 [Verrucomicrobiales bacterium]|nr:hypothetical protein [Verrucomicrobiales bacterium]